MQLKYLDLQGLTSFHEQLAAQIENDITEAGTALETSLQSWVNEKLGVASGIATLDASGKLTSSQLPDISFPDYTNTYVSLTSDQSIAGNKTFTGTTTFATNLQITSTGISKVSGTLSVGSSSLPIDNIYATSFHGNLEGNASSATTATQLGTSTVGNNMTPIYLADGVPTVMPYSIQTSVPADAKFTDTVYTLPITTDGALGGIRTGYTGSEEKRYAIDVDTDGKAFVDVPWTDTTYTLSSFGITATAAELNYTRGVTSNIQSQLSELNTQLSTKVNSSLIGAVNGIASLDSTGKVPSAQLPSYVDDVVEGTLSAFPQTGEAGKIYVDTTTNLSYRWSGSSYVEISPSIALGETSSTAYRGDLGAVAYAHSQLTSGNPHNVTYTDVGAPASNGTGASGTWGISITGNAATATTATSASSATSIGSKSVTLTGDVTGSTTWDTSGNLSIATTIANTGPSDVTVNKYYWHTEFTASTSSVTIDTWSYFSSLSPDVEVYFNGFLLFPIGSDGVGEYSFNSGTGTITFPSPLGGNTTQQQIVVVIRTYNKDAVVIPQVVTPVISVVE